MLRLYKPITDDIFKLQEYLEYLVSAIWCGEQKEECDKYLDVNLKPLFDKYEWFRNEIKTIYEECKNLSVDDKKKIIDTFKALKNISEVCEGNIIPLKIKQLPIVVEELIKPFFVKCYESLLERSLVPGDKLQYYNSIIKENKYKFCPCCGYVSFESAESNYREAYDHYLPKAEYPFASVNFFNLVPLCYKCNSDRKSTKNPVNGRKAYYPFSLNPETHIVDIQVKFSHIKVKDYDNFEKKELQIELLGDDEKCNTWDDVFDIKERYFDEVKSFSKNLLKEMKKRWKGYKDEGINKSYVDIIDREIDLMMDDKYDDRKFLKIAFLQEVKNCNDIVEVYSL